MRDDGADDELPPCVGERYRDVLAHRAIATLDDYAPEPRRKPYKRDLRPGVRTSPETVRGAHRAN